MREPTAIRIAGISGQGSILAGLVLAKALVYEGKWVTHTQSYSAQVRGDVSWCDVLFADTPIDYPKSDFFDVLCVLHQKAMDELHRSLKSNGVLILDSVYVRSIPDFIKRVTRKVIALPLAEKARECCGTFTFANIIMLGVLAKSCGLVSLDSLKRALKDYVKKHLIEDNLKALEIGYNLVERKFEISKPERVWKKFGAGFE